MSSGGDELLSGQLVRLVRSRDRVSPWVGKPMVSGFFSQMGVIVVPETADP